MAKTNEFDFEKPVPIDADEDEATLAAIDKGVRDAKAGRTVSLSQVRKLLSKRITNSVAPRNR